MARMADEVGQNPAPAPRASFDMFGVMVRPRTMPSVWNSAVTLDRWEVSRLLGHRSVGLPAEVLERSRGRLVVADLLSDDFEVDDDIDAASAKLYLRKPDGFPLAWTVGVSWLPRLGWRGTMQMLAAKSHAEAEINTTKDG